MRLAERYRYKNRRPYRERIARLAWCGVQLTLFRLFPHFIGKAWRKFLLSCFGATLGSKVNVWPSCRVWAPWKLETGTFVAIDECVDVYNVEKITIGNFVAISRRAFLCTATHDISDVARQLVARPIIIRDGVWIGAQAYIGPGVTIGEGAVIGACAVVTKDVPPWVVMAGNPARAIRERPVNRDEWKNVFRTLAEGRIGCGGQRSATD